MRKGNIRYDFVNDAYLQMFNHKKLVGKTVKEALPEMQDQGYFDKLDRVYNTGKPYCERGKPIKINEGDAVKNYYRDVSYNPLFDKSGNTNGIFVQTNDITEQINAEKELGKAHDEKQVLLEELHHRVNNNLSVIISLLQLESDDIDEPKIWNVLKSTESRIYTIADIQNYLYYDEYLTHIPFDNFIMDLPNKIYDHYNIDPPIIKIFAEEGLLNVNQAVSLGLLLNEIFSYFAQFHSKDLKEITLTSSSSGPTITINIKIGAFNYNLQELAASEEGFKTNLIHLLAEQLQAELDISPSEIALRFQQNEQNGSFNNLAPAMN